MKLYYAPLACSLADHIALEEVGARFEHESVDLRFKLTASGRNFLEITNKGYVPALVLDSGEILTENIAILDWLASRYPELAVAGPLGRTRTLEAMTFISTELHRAFKPMWHPSTERQRDDARKSIAGLFQFVSDTFAGDFLFGEQPSVADFYLFVMLLWARRFDVPATPKLIRMREIMLARPAVQTAMRAEGLR